LKYGKAPGRFWYVPNRTEERFLFGGNTPRKMT
jgi:hypothetical protein